eukprot:4452788-Prymnesium_polylepis.1
MRAAVPMYAACDDWVPHKHNETERNPAVQSCDGRVRERHIAAVGMISRYKQHAQTPTDSAQRYPGYVTRGEAR